MLGVLSQESNLLQASSRAAAGESSNFIQGGYYGNAGSVHTVNWAAADCGYGISQVTSGMTAPPIRSPISEKTAWSGDSPSTGLASL